MYCIATLSSTESGWGVRTVCFYLRELSYTAHTSLSEHYIAFLLTLQLIQPCPSPETELEIQEVTMLTVT